VLYLLSGARRLPSSSGCWHRSFNFLFIVNLNRIELPELHCTSSTNCQEERPASGQRTTPMITDTEVRMWTQEERATTLGS